MLICYHTTDSFTPKEKRKRKKEETVAVPYSQMLAYYLLFNLNLSLVLDEKCVQSSMVFHCICAPYTATRYGGAVFLVSVSQSSQHNKDDIS